MSATPLRPFASGTTKVSPRNQRKQPTQSRAKATVDAIHEAAFQVLREVGFERMTTTRVALRAGVSVGTLYQYYSDKDALSRALVVEYLGNAAKAMKAVLEDQGDLPTLARHFVRRFITFKLQGAEHSEPLRAVFFSGNRQSLLNESTELVVETLTERIRATKPKWSVARAREIANAWASIVFGATTAIMEREPKLIAEPWFGESLERAVLAQLRESKES